MVGIVVPLAVPTRFETATRNYYGAR